MISLVKIVWAAFRQAWRHTSQRYTGHTFVFVGASVIALISWLLPALVVNQTIAPNVIVVILAFFAFILIWYNAAYSGIRAVARLYGYRVKSLLLVETEQEERGQLPGRTLGSIIISFSNTVYGFALTYGFMSLWRPESFNVNKLGVFGGLYFSLTTIATVGFGDILPITRLARSIVMCEILSGMLYAVFIFAIVATFLRERIQL
ncbi:MAG: potassium channel family protein [Candidatus Angelobacter sp.]